LFVFTKQNPIDNAMATFSPFITKNKNVFAETKINEAIKPITIKVKPIAVPDTTFIDKTNVVKPVKVAEEWYRQPYQIVLGCFAVKQNAYKLINQLEQQNLIASISGQNAKSLYVVSVAGYEDEKDAHKKLIEIKKQYPAAWLYKR
jgi:hypothetical protein